MPSLVGQSKRTGMLEPALRHPMGRLMPSGHTGGRPATAAPMRAAGSAGSARVPRRLVRLEPLSPQLALEACLGGVSLGVVGL